MGFPSWRRLCMVGALVELVCVLSMVHGSFAQGNDCSAAIITPLLPCLPYIQPGNTSKPSSDCCSPLQSLFASTDPTCICQIGPIAQQVGISVNQTRALEVVSLCNQTVPESVQSCLATQATAPLGAPSITPTISPSNPTAPPGGAPSIAPPPQTGSDHSNLGSNFSPPSSILICSIFVALFLHIRIIST